MEKFSFNLNVSFSEENAGNFVAKIFPKNRRIFQSSRNSQSDLVTKFISNNNDSISSKE
jgi:hypothetical protein